MDEQTSLDGCKTTTPDLANPNPYPNSFISHSPMQVDDEQMCEESEVTQGSRVLELVDSELQREGIRKICRPRVPSSLGEIDVIRAELSTATTSSCES